MKRPLLVALALAALSASLLAQAPKGLEGSKGAPSPSPAPAAEPGKIGLEEFVETPGGYSYNPQGRRDPFVSLLRPVQAGGPKTRKPGMEGFLIQEVALKGIVRTPGGGMGVAAKPGFIALFAGPDPTKSYFATTGQRLYDGVITAVDSNSVTFLQEVTDPLSPVKTREVKKNLYASEEARQ